MRKAGFTLMELMVVVAIIFFLAAISVPQYFKYVVRVKQAEVAINSRIATYGYADLLC